MIFPRNVPTFDSEQNLRRGFGVLVHIRFLVHLGKYFEVGVSHIWGKKLLRKSKNIFR